MAAYADETARRISIELTTPREVPGYRFCGYCGAPCRGLTCRAHRDLLALDPNTALGVAAAVREVAQ